MEKVNRVNKKRLRRELIIVAAVVLVAGLAYLVFWLKDASFYPSDAYASYKSLYNIAKNYDYSKGRDLELEARIDRAVSQNTSSVQYYYNLKAEVEYYSRVELWHTALKALDEALKFAVTPNEQMYVYQRYADVYNGLGLSEKAESYQSIVDQYRTSVPVAY